MAAESSRWTAELSRKDGISRAIYLPEKLSGVIITAQLTSNHKEL